MAKDESAARELFDSLLGDRGDGPWSGSGSTIARRKRTTSSSRRRRTRRTAPSTEPIASTLQSLSRSPTREAGLLVFGVDAGAGEVNGVGFDVFRSVQPIADAPAFGGALERRIKSFTHLPISAPRRSRRLRSGIQGRDCRHPRTDERWWATPCSFGIRGGERPRSHEVRSAVQTMPHPLSADRFGRTARASLVLEVGVAGLEPVRFDLVLHNRGRGSAHRPAVLIRYMSSEGVRLRLPDAGSPLSTGFRRRIVPARPPAVPMSLFEPSEDVVIYPETSRACVRSGHHHCAQPALAILRLEIELHALDMKPVRDARIFPVGGPDTTASQILLQRVVFGEK